MPAGDKKRVRRSSDFTEAALGFRCPSNTQGPDHYTKIALHVRELTKKKNHVRICVLPALIPSGDGK